MQNITPCFWFNRQAEEAANFYVSLFRNSRISTVLRYPENSPGGEAGTVMTVCFELDGQEYLALNGGPEFNFTEAISLIVYCEDQGEVDRMWAGLTEGGEEVQCGWLKDKFGISWQVVPRVLDEMFSNPDTRKVDRVNQAMLKMVKLDIAELKRAFDGN
mgnify:CR=1 FL=1